MTGYDMGIAFHSKLNEVRECIKSLENISIDMTDIKESVDSIEESIEKDVERDYENFPQNTASSFLSDTLSVDYRKAIERLDRINDFLKREWEMYYTINVSCSILKDLIENIDENNISNAIFYAKDLLDKMITSTTIDFNTEKSIVLEVYELVYKVIKLELVYTKKDSLLEYAKANSINISYLVDELKKDVSKLGNSEKREIEKKIMELERGGIDNSLLLDKDLMMLLAIYSSNDLKEKSIHSFLKSAEEYESILEKFKDLKDSKVALEKIVNDLLEEKKKYFRKGISKRFLIFLNTILMTAGLTAGVVGTRELAKTNSYRTITSTYDSSTDEWEHSESFDVGADGKVTMIEYSPWDSPGYYRDKYKRTVYEYDLSDVDVEDFDINELLKDNKGKFECSEKKEETIEKPDDYGYGENKYVITTVKKDLSQSMRVDRPNLWSLLGVLTSVGIIFADISLWKLLSKESLKLIKEKSKTTNNDIESRRVSIEKVERSFEEILQNKKTVESEIEAAYGALPEVLKQLPEVKDVKQKVLKREE